MAPLPAESRVEQECPGQVAGPWWRVLTDQGATLARVCAQSFGCRNVRAHHRTNQKRHEEAGGPGASKQRHVRFNRGRSSMPTGTAGEGSRTRGSIGSDGFTVRPSEKLPQRKKKPRIKTGEITSGKSYSTCNFMPTTPQVQRKTQELSGVQGPRTTPIQRAGGGGTGGDLSS